MVLGDGTTGGGSSPEMAGYVVAGRFDQLYRVASGGMGDVYRARDLQTGEVVAIKLLRVADDDNPRRFLAEGRVLSQLRHRSIVRYIAHGLTPRGECYLAMEWLEGQDLRARLA